MGIKFSDKMDNDVGPKMDLDGDNAMIVIDHTADQEMKG